MSRHDIPYSADLATVSKRYFISKLVTVGVVLEWTNEILCIDHQFHSKAFHVLRSLNTNFFSSLTWRIKAFLCGRT